MATDEVARNQLFERVLKVHNRDGLISCSIRVSYKRHRAPNEPNRLKSHVIYHKIVCEYPLNALKYKQFMTSYFKNPGAAVLPQGHFLFLWFLWVIKKAYSHGFK